MEGQVVVVFVTDYVTPGGDKKEAGKRYTVGATEGARLKKKGLAVLHSEFSEKMIVKKSPRNRKLDAPASQVKNKVKEKKEGEK